MHMCIGSLSLEKMSQVFKKVFSSVFVWNTVAIYFHFTEFESCSINSTRGTDEAHCRALGTFCRTTAQGRQELVLQKHLPSSGTHRFSDNYDWFLEYRSVLPIACRYAALLERYCLLC